MTKLRMLLCFFLLMLLSVLPAQASSPCPNGIFKGIPLHGKVQVVSAFPDIRVQVVSAFPDLKVQSVKALPDKIGQWQFVEAFPDFKIQYVEAFPDLKIQFVGAFPGLP